MYILRNLFLFVFLLSHGLVHGQGTTVSSVTNSKVTPSSQNKRHTFTEEQKNACISEIKKIFTGLSDKKILKFVKAQTNLTLHRLAWTHMSYLKSQNKNSITGNDTIEKSLLALIGGTQAKISAQASELRNDYFEEAKRQFDQKARALDASTYRQALATLAPNIRTAVKEKMKKQIKGAETVFALNSSDIMMMSLLSEEVNKNQKTYKNLWKGYYSQNGSFIDGSNKSKSQYYETNNSGKLKATHRINLLTMINSSYLNMDNSDKSILAQLKNLEEVTPILNKEVNKLFIDMVTPENSPKCFEQIKKECVGIRSRSLMTNFDEISRLLAEEVDRRAANADNPNFQQQLIENLRLCHHHLRVAGECPNEANQTIYCDGPGCKCIDKPDDPEPVPPSPNGKCDPPYIQDPVTKFCNPPKGSCDPPYIQDPVTKFCNPPKGSCNPGFTWDQSINKCKPDSVTPTPGTTVINNLTINIANNTTNIDIVKLMTQYPQLLYLTPYLQPQPQSQSQSQILIYDQSTGTLDPYTGGVTTGGVTTGGTTTGGTTTGGTTTGGTTTGGTTTDPNRPSPPLAERWSIKANLHDFTGYPEGKMVDATVTRGKNPDRQEVKVEWSLPKDLKGKLSAFEADSFFNFNGKERSKTTAQRHAIYIKGIKTYTVVVTLYFIDKKDVKQILDVDKVEITKPKKYGEFNCNLPLNATLSICQKAQGNFMNLGFGVLGGFVF